MNQGDMIDRGFLGSILPEGAEELEEKGGPEDENQTLPKMFSQEPKRRQATLGEPETDTQPREQATVEPD